MLTSAAAGDSSFLSEFSELEMDRYDDVNILSRSMTEISADVNEVLTQLGGFIGRVEGDIDEFTKLAHHLQDEITAAPMVPIRKLYSRLSPAVRHGAHSAGQIVELELFCSVTELAGSGVGLDVVRANLNTLNGEIEINSAPGQGTKFTLKVPLTLIISPALFVRCGTANFALPLAVVEEIRRIRADEIEDVGGKLLTKVRDVVTEVVRLDSYLGLPPLGPINGYFRMVVANAGNRKIGVVVEEVLGKDEIVIKNLGEYLRRVKLFPGTTIAPDGSLILLIDLNRMVATEPSEHRAIQASASAARIFAPGSTAVASGSIPSEAIDRVEQERVIVVADNSISVRKFVGRMLEKNGYRVKLAADGLEAAELVTQHGCHLVITDLEMPRMTGYELMVQLRQTPSTRRIPVMVVTSRAGT